MSNNNLIALPWERQPTEMWKAYSAFCIYRDLEPYERKLVNVVKKSKRSIATISKWCKQYNWENRLTALVEYEERVKFDTQQKEREKMNKVHCEWAREIAEKGMSVIRYHNIEDISPRDGLEFIKVAANLERLVRGESTENVKTQHTVTVNNMTQNILANPEAAMKAVDLFDAIVEDKSLQIKNKNSDDS